ncbi:MAG TPA: biopolymer transporter ExbD, partial [Thermoanaerobaculia bacterium]|nr:biopolymer transporter ExbD [Thermoanaerobaculia bacterium]
MLTLPALRHSYYAAVASPLLVLLFCFAASQPYCHGFEPLMPRFAAATPWPGHEGDLVISVREDGRFLIGQDYVRRDQLCDMVEQRMTWDPNREILLQIDRRAPFAGTRVILQTLRHLGIRHVVLRSGNA